MGALWAAVSCSLMMIIAVGAIAWFALAGRNRATTSESAPGGTDEVARLRAEIAEFRRERAASDESARRA